MPTWFPAAYMKAPANMVMQRMFCRPVRLLFA